MPPVNAAQATALEVGEQPSRRSKFVAVLVGAVWVLLAALLQLARQKGVPAYDSIWAEDGHLFLTTALNHPESLTLILAPAGEYMHLVPRLLAVVASALPIQWAAPFFAVASAFLVGLLSLYVYGASRRLIPSPLVRGVIAALVVLLPAARFEVTNNAANLHYYLLFACFWALLHHPKRLWGAVSACVVVVAATMSDPSAALLIPLAIWSFFTTSRPLHRAIPVVFAVGILVQGAVVANASDRYSDDRVAVQIRDEIADRTFAPRAYGESNPLDLPRLYGVRVVGAFVVGDRFIEPAWRLLGWSLGYAGFLVFCLLFLYVARKRELKNRKYMLIASVYSAAFFTFPVWVRGTEHLTPSAESFSFGASRFVIVPMLLLATTVAILLSEAPRLRERTWRTFQGVALLLCISLMIANYTAENFRSGGPSWSKEVNEAGRDCRLSGSEHVRIPIAPSLSGDVFNVLVSCARLQEDVDAIAAPGIL